MSPDPPDLTTPAAGRPMTGDSYVAKAGPRTCLGGCQGTVQFARRGDGADVTLILRDGSPVAEHDNDACGALVPPAYFDGDARGGRPWSGTVSR